MVTVMVFLSSATTAPAVDGCPKLIMIVLGTFPGKTLGLIVKGSFTKLEPASNVTLPPVALIV